MRTIIATVLAVTALACSLQSSTAQLPSSVTISAQYLVNPTPYVLTNWDVKPDPYGDVVLSGATNGLGFFSLPNSGYSNVTFGPPVVGAIGTGVIALQLQTPTSYFVAEYQATSRTPEWASAPTVGVSGLANNGSFSYTSVQVDSNDAVISAYIYTSPTLTVGVASASSSPQTVTNPNPGTASVVITSQHDGTYSWAQTIGAVDGQTVTFGVVCDKLNAIIVVGQFSGSIVGAYSGAVISKQAANPLGRAGPTAAFVAKYTTAGMPVFVGTVSGTGAGMGEAFTSVTALPDNSIVAAGYFGKSWSNGALVQTALSFSSSVAVAGYGTNSFLVKYDTNGNALWAVAPSVSASTVTFRITTISSDASGNIYFAAILYGGSVTLPNAPGIAGSATVTSTDFGNFILFLGANIVIGKYSSAGQLAYANILVGVGAATGLAVDAGGNLFVAGFFGGSSQTQSLQLNTLNGGTAITLSAFSGTSPNIPPISSFLASYTSQGSLLFAQRAGGASQDRFMSMGLTSTLGAGSTVTNLVYVSFASRSPSMLFNEGPNQLMAPGPASGFVVYSVNYGAPTTTPAATTSSGGLSGGAIFGIVFAVLVVVGGAAYFIWRRMKSQAAASTVALEGIQTSHDTTAAAAAPAAAPAASS